MLDSCILCLVLFVFLTAAKVEDDGIVFFRQLTSLDAKAISDLNVAIHPGMVQSVDYWNGVLSTSSNLGAFNRRKELIGAVTTIPDLILSPTGRKMTHPEELLLLERHRKVAYISHLMVASNMRRRGIATQLMRKIMEKLRDNGTEAFCLHTHKGNAAAARLYETLGYTNEARYTAGRDSNAMFFVYRICEFGDTIRRRACDELLGQLKLSRNCLCFGRLRFPTTCKSMTIDVILNK